MHINSIFVKIWNINIHTQKIYENLNIPKSIPKKFLFFLLSDGSCSRNLAALQGINTHIKLYNQEILFTCPDSFVSISYNNYLHRKVWLTNNKINKLAFAESYWKLYHDPYNILYQNNHEPVGKIFITSEKDIHRNLQNIYCGYSALLNKELHNSNLLWGKSYNIVLNNKVTIFMHEIFSSFLLNNL